MPSAWLLPEDIADVLPAQARRIEDLRRSLLDLAHGYGFELVIPPLVEYLDSLLSGTGHTLDLQTFKLIDQLSGRTLGLRADTTPQVARIDAHLLAREGVARLCYCGPVVHTRARAPEATREPLQFGAEVYGHAGLEADLEVVELALDGLQVAGVDHTLIDLGDARIVRDLLVGTAPERAAGVTEALSRKDAAALAHESAPLPGPTRRSLHALLDLYGGDDVLIAARRVLPDGAARALDDLEWLAARIRRSHPEVRLSFDLADTGGYAYYSGPCFAAYGARGSGALLRGGRYDEVGAVFGRNRPAVGFSLDLKQLAAVVAPHAAPGAILAPWDEDLALRDAVRSLRSRGDIVVRALPGHERDMLSFDCDRELVPVNGQWVVRSRTTR
jgi:ATP phosphoribosyltransferase regulatory subunit